MNEQMEFEYYYGEESEQHIFLQLPKFLLKEPRFAELSDTSKILYSLMLERMALSRKNGWFDEQNRAYIYFSVDYAKEELHRSKPTVIKAMKEIEAIGLIERIIRGQGKPTIIYVKKFIYMKKVSNPEAEPEVKNLDFKRSTSLTSRSKESKPQEVKDDDFKDSSNFTLRGKGSELQGVNSFCPNNIEFNNTEVNDNIPVQSFQSEDRYTRPLKVGRRETDSRTKKGQMIGEDMEAQKTAYEMMLKKQVHYEDTIQQKEFSDYKDIIDGIINIITDMAITASQGGMITVNQREIPFGIVAKRLLKTDYDVLTHVLSKFIHSTTSKKNIRNYLITSLYNAPDEMAADTKSQLNHDGYGC